MKRAIESLNSKYPGVGMRRDGERWAVTVPETYNVGHEAHFAQVTQNFLKYLRSGKLPAWEVPNMLTKYATTHAGVSAQPRSVRALERRRTSAPALTC